MVESFLEELGNNEKIDFIGYVETPFHLIGLKAYILYLQDTLKRNIEGIIIEGYHETAGALLNDDVLVINGVGKFKVFRFKQSELKRLRVKTVTKKYEETVYILTPLAPWVKLAIQYKRLYKQKVCTVRLDDGTGTYFTVNHLDDLFFRKNREYKSILKKMFFEKVKEFVACINGVEEKRFSIFSKNDFLNAEVCDFYRKAIELGVDRKKNIDEKYIIYLGTVDKNPMVQKRHNMLINNFLERKYREGYKIYIKLHPRDKMGISDLRIPFVELERNVAIEYMIAAEERKPDLVLGHGSTALIILAKFWNVQTMSLWDPMYINEFAYEFNSMVLDNSEKIKNIRLMDINKLSEY